MKTISWRCPSNIALVKYWGKTGVQLPCNPSISFTLRHAYTDMAVSYEKTNVTSFTLDFLFENQPNEKFKDKIVKFIHTYWEKLNFLQGFHLHIQSTNSFPHSTGIASSASSMGALALTLCSLEDEIKEKTTATAEFLQKASFWARLASGSACRSVYPHLAVWGATAAVAGSSDHYAVPFTTFHPIFKTYQNRILIVSSKEKTVSSRAGHALMNKHPFAKVRYEQANNHLNNLVVALQTGDIEAFTDITEQEALTLHALMMNSSPSVILMQPNTLVVLDLIKEFRATTKLPIAYTLDAGPNIHFLFPQEIASQVDTWLDTVVKPYLENGRIIRDEVGEGATKL
jgi:diphosphomevalonate decarboxylase